uniref:nickel-dependent lactate racemase n=1 Tax=Tetragenococcus halophilus TaxID=51669 RepID=UPI0024E0A989
MVKQKVLYGKGYLDFEIADDRVGELVLSKTDSYQPKLSEKELCKEALKNPIGSDKLSELAKDKKDVVIIASDHTRPVPSKIMMPLMLKEIREKNPDIDITILISTGTHRSTTDQELINKFGEEIVKNEKVVVHDAVNSELVKIGKLPSGSDLLINKRAFEADLLVAEGFIEPHFFAGYSGGRKSVFPGITSRKSVVANHCAEYIADENSRTGILKNNPIHEEMISAARQANLAFIFNVVLNSEKDIIYAVAGDMEKAHLDGTNFLSELAGAEPEK